MAFPKHDEDQPRKSERRRLLELLHTLATVIGEDAEYDWRSSGPLGQSGASEGMWRIELQVPEMAFFHRHSQLEAKREEIRRRRS